MPSITPTKAELQKGYRQLENFALDQKVHNVIRQAAKNPRALKMLKADPLKYFQDKRLKLPADVKITVNVTILQFCFWICRRVGRYHVICVRYCGRLII